MIRCERCRRRLSAAGAEHTCLTLEERRARMDARARGTIEPPPAVDVGDDAWAERKDIG